MVVWPFFGEECSYVCMTKLSDLRILRVALSLPWRLWLPAVPNLQMLILSSSKCECASWSCWMEKFCISVRGSQPWLALQHLYDADQAASALRLDVILICSDYCHSDGKPVSSHYWLRQSLCWYKNILLCSQTNLDEGTSVEVAFLLVVMMVAQQVSEFFRFSDSHGFPQWLWWVTVAKYLILHGT